MSSASSCAGRHTTLTVHPLGTTAGSDGPNQEGMVGPSLINSLKTLSKEDFIKTVRDGRLDKGMQSFGTSQVVMDNINQLYAYLKGRSDGAITRSKVEPISQ